MTTPNISDFWLVRPFAWLLGYRDVPVGRRQLFRIDFQSFLLWSAMMALAGKNITQAIIDKGPAQSALSASALTLLLGLLASANAAGNVASAFWAWLASGRDSIRFILIPSTVAGLSSIAIALVPADRPWLFSALIVLQFVAMSGVVTLRSGVWHLHYYRAGVGNIVSRFQMAALIVSTIIALGASALLDGHPTLYRWMFPLLGAAGIWAGFRCQAMRGRRDLPEGPRRTRGTLLIGWRILMRDQPYRRFLLFMTIFGFGNLMSDAVLVKFLGDAFDVNFTVNALYLILLPNVVTLMVMPIAGRMLDKSNPMRLRSYGAMFWGVSRAVLLVAALTVSEPLIWVSMILTGMGMGIGSIAWQLGHMHFAPRELVQHYMGLHVTSTGLRGIIAPPLGMLLFSGAVLPGWLGGGTVPAIGGWVFLISFVMAGIGAAGFVWMDRRYRRLTPLGPEVII